MCRSVAKWRFHMMVKYNGFVMFFSRRFSFLFFRFLGQPTCRKFGPNRTLNGSNVVFRLIRVLFEGVVPSNSL